MFIKALFDPGDLSACRIVEKHLKSPLFAIKTVGNCVQQFLQLSKIVNIKIRPQVCGSEKVSRSLTLINF